MNDHGKLDFKFCSWHCQNKKWKQQDQTEMCTNRRPKLPRKIVNQGVLEKKVSFSSEHIYFDEQLLPQINIYCGEVTQNNEMTSLIAQSLLACSILVNDYQVAVLAFKSKS